MATYANAFYQPRTNGSDPAVYATDVAPIEYRGFRIYQRLRKVCFDVVTDGVCVGQYAGLSGAKGLIDLIHDEPNDFWALRAMSALASVKALAA